MKNAAEKIYDFMNTVEKLCYVNRDIFRKDGTKEPDSDHIMKLALLLMMVMPYVKQPINAQKVLELALVHDLVEADVGDTPRLQSDHCPDIRAQKKAKEMAAIIKYRDLLPEPIGQKIYDLFIEYEERASPEAKLVKIFDRFEGDMQTFKEIPTLLNRKLNNERHEFVLNYLREDVAAAEKNGEPLIAEMQKIQLDLAEQKVQELQAQGLI
ncbi:MAG: HD domain-containing protein [Rickettsiales bacterium]|jgi:putative hydrolase of HD superfamily|nr:HD domain-containing protein [Rickettsiales bacterium]